MKNEKSAGAVIYYYDGEPYFLLLKYKNYWGFAKGLIEENESEEETASREVKEETSLEVKFIPGFKERQKWFFRLNGELINKEASYFLAKVSKDDADKVKISFEHEDFKWLNLDDCLKLVKIKANKELLEKTENFIREIEKQKKLF